MAHSREHADHKVETLDRYQLVSRLGRGGMAEVYRAKLTSIGGYERDVALKVLLPSYAAEPEFVEMLLDEARIAGAIDHPNVLQVLDVGRVEGIFYLVMEYVDGRDLRSIAKQIPGGRLPLGMALYVLYEMLRGLQAVHAAVDERGQPRNIVHRDISPGNVLVDRRGFVKLGDFGIARASGRITRTRVGAVKGKSRYMAPEQLTGADIDHRADLYAAGVTLFEAILGDYARESSTPSIYGPMFTWPERLPQGAVPADVEAILRRAIHPSPELRYHSAAEMRGELEIALQRWAPGYGPDTLARELRRLLTGSAKSVPVSVEAQRDAKAAGVALQKVRWRGAATVEHALPEMSAFPSVPGNGSGPIGLGDQVSSVSVPTVASLVTAPVPSQPSLDAMFVAPPVVDAIETLPSELLTSDSRLMDLSGDRLPARLWQGLERRVGRRMGAGLIVAALALLIGSIATAVASSGGSVADPTRPELASSVARAAVPPVPRAVPLPVVGTLDVRGPVGAVLQIDGNLYPSAPTQVELAPGAHTVRLYAGKRRRIARTVRVVAGRTVTLE